MTKLIVLFALLACSACAGTFVDGPTYGGGGDRGVAASDDAPAARPHFAEREAPAREVAFHPHILQREGEFVICAQCRR